MLKKNNRFFSLFVSYFLLFCFLCLVFASLLKRRGVGPKTKTPNKKEYFRSPSRIPTHPKSPTPPYLPICSVAALISRFGIVIFFYAPKLRCGCFRWLPPLCYLPSTFPLPSLLSHPLPPPPPHFVSFCYNSFVFWSHYCCVRDGPIAFEPASLICRHQTLGEKVKRTTQEESGEKMNSNLVRCIFFGSQCLASSETKAATRTLVVTTLCDLTFCAAVWSKRRGLLVFFSFLGGKRYGKGSNACVLFLPPPPRDKKTTRAQTGFFLLFFYYISVDGFSSLQESRTNMNKEEQEEEEEEEEED